MSFSEFTKEDYRIIDEAYASLFELAKRRCRSDEELSCVKKSFEFANQAHKNIRRRSGEPYIIHPIEVAKIVITEIGLGCKSICAALIHDVVEDTGYTVEEIRTLFGDKIASLVDGLTKIKTVLDNENKKSSNTSNTESLQAENFKRILLTLNDDIRVVLIKLADRLHNCRTIDSMPEHKRDKILSETMYIFIPLAHRLGLYGVKSEMENIWLRHKEPEDFREISEHISANIASRDKDIDEFIAPIERALKDAGFKFSIKKRIKTPYSIWYKMHTKHLPIEQIFDLYAVRIIFEPKQEEKQNEKSQAYLIFSLITNLYSENFSRRRDWISQPKSNGYEALHCTLMSHAGVWIEVQIRSKRMDDIAEKGIAAHWAYKNAGYVSDNDAEVNKWLREIQEILESNDVSALELLDIIHKDLVSSEIVVFTPKGDQKSIIHGSTALDFAYLIHDQIGNKAIAAKVNMKLVPLSYVLKSGDQVEIITATNATPKTEWLQFLQTRSAKSKVMEYFRKDRDKLAIEGKIIFEDWLKTLGLKNNEKLLSRFMDYCQLKDSKEFYFRIGLGAINQDRFLSIIDEDKMSAQGSKKSMPKADAANVNYKIADCCNPLPGEPVVGFFLDSRTIVVHKKSCPVAERLASCYGNRVIVPQQPVSDKEFPVRIFLKGLDRMGLLNEISNVISKSLGVNMRKLQLSSEGGVFEGYIELLVHDVRMINKLGEGLRAIEGIQDVIRTDI